MLFVLDHNIAADVARVIRAAKHECVQVAAAGLATANDDAVSVFADNRRGVLLTHDRELIDRRRRNTFGHHVHLDCRAWESAAIVQDHLETIVALVSSRDAIVIKLSKDGAKPYRRRWI